MKQTSHRIGCKAFVASASCISALILASGAKADDQAPTWHGFFTSGVAFTDKNTGYDGGLTKRADIERLTHLGLNIQKNLSERWDFAAQIIADSNTISPDWAFVSWYPIKGLTLRVGKQKAPMWLMSDRIDVGHTYPWIAPPEEVYSFNPIKRASGLGATYRLALGGGLEAVAEGLISANSTDTLTVTEGASKNSTFQVKLNYRRLGVINLALGNEAFQVRAGYTKAAVGIKTDFYQIKNLNAGFGTVGLKVDTHGFLLLSEYASNFGSVDQSEINEANTNLIAAGTASAMAGAKAAQTGSPTDIQAAQTAGTATQAAYLQDAAVHQMVGAHGWYATTGYQVGPVLPFITLAQLRNPTSSNVVNYGSQDSASLGIKYDANPYTDLKLQGQHVWPKNGSRGIQDVSTTGSSYKQLNVFQAAVDVAF